MWHAFCRTFILTKREILRDARPEVFLLHNKKHHEIERKRRKLSFLFYKMSMQARRMKWSVGNSTTVPEPVNEPQHNLLLDSSLFARREREKFSI